MGWKESNLGLDFLDNQPTTADTGGLTHSGGNCA